jgi:transcriptional regulator with XRE-family HTH domain
MPASKVLERFGQRIKELRRQKGMTQEQLADKAHLHNTYIGSVERGEKNISMINIEKIVKALGVSLSEFFSTLRK